MLRARPISFRRILALLLLCYVLGAAPSLGRSGTAAEAAVQTIPSPFGLNTHLATRVPRLTPLDEAAGAVELLGAKWAREDFAWPRIEPRSGAWNWAPTDTMVAAHRANGVQILGRLGYSVGWATADGSGAPDGQSFARPDLEAWRRYVGATAARYRGRVRYWEIWNEPDSSTFWQGQPNPTAYAELLRAANSAIKAVDPAAVVVLGGISPFDPTFLAGLAKAGAWSAFDVLAIHPYTSPVSPEQGLIGASGVGGMRALLNRYGDKPIWVTEVGWETGTVDEQKQANYLVRAYMQLLAEPGVAKVFWYTLHDDPRSPFGLLRFGKGYADYSSRKPAFNAYTTMTRQLAGARFAGMGDLSITTRLVEGWERTGGWLLAGPQNGNLSISLEQARNGSRSARYYYRFPGRDNDYVAFRPASPIDLGQPAFVGLSVFGDNSGHLLQLQLEDETGERLQFPLGKLGAANWTWMQAPVKGLASSGNRLGGGNNNGRLDGRVRLHALVIDDLPNPTVGAGTIWIDDLTAISGPEAYSFRWQRGSETIDVVFAPGGAYVSIPSASQTAGIVDRDGGVTRVKASGGFLRVWADDRPRYIHHTP